MTSLQVGLTQLTSTDDLQHNLQQVENLIARADGVDLVVFPENSLFFRIRGGGAIEGLVWGGVELRRLQTCVDRAQRATLLTTPVQEKALANATILFEPRREPRIVYRKIHLFDVDVPGAPPVRESDFFAGGTEPALIEFRGWKLGLSICYDLRFAELYSRYAQVADLILVPSAFLVPTGEAHWHTLLRARAIENQCFVVASAQSGDHRSGDQVRRTYGHALAIDPWGRVLTELETSPSVARVELDPKLIAQVRGQIPMSGHRRLGKGE